MATTLGRVGRDGQGSKCAGGDRLEWRLACDGGLESEACTCIDSNAKLCKERGVWGGSREPPPAESVTIPPGGTPPSTWASS